MDQAAARRLAGRRGLAARSSKAAPAFTVRSLAALAIAAGLSTQAVALPPPPSLDAYAAEDAVSDAAIAPGGASVAFYERADAGPRVRMLTRTTNGLAGDGFNLGPNPFTALMWVGDDDLLVVRQTVMGGGGSRQGFYMPRQRVNKGFFFNRISRSFTQFLTAPTNVANILAGGTLKPGSVGGEPVVFARLLAPGPTFRLFRVSARTGVGVAAGDASFDVRRWAVTPSGDIVGRFLESDRQPLGAVQLRDGATWRSVNLDAALGPVDLLGLGRGEGSLLVRQGRQAYDVSPAGTPTPLLPADAGLRSYGHDDLTGRLRWISTAAGAAPIFFDDVLASSWRAAVAAAPSERLDLVDADHAGRELLLFARRPGAPGRLMWRHADGSQDVLGSLRPAITDEQIAPVESLALKASDGFGLTGRLVTPPARKAERLALVVRVREIDAAPVEGFDAGAQMLASRGYAVLDLDYRGAAGLSPAHAAAAAGQLGGRMQSDLADAVAELGRAGRIDPTRVCILGSGLYAGYAALVAAAGSGGYRCAISINGLADLTSTLERPTSADRGGMWERYALWSRAAGKATAAELSPARRAADVKTPLLQVEDLEWASPSSGAEGLHKALLKAGRASQFVELEGPLQSTRTPTGRRDEYARELAFLAQHNPA